LAFKDKMGSQEFCGLNPGKEISMRFRRSL